MKRGIIYIIINKQTEEKYIGSTELPINKEWAQHIDRSKRMSPEPLHKAFREYGIHNFMMREIEEYDETNLEQRLESWIRKFNPEYNPVNTVIEEKKEEIVIPVKEKKKSPGNPQYLIPFNDKTRSDGKHSGLKIRGRNLETGKVYDWNSAREAALEITGDAKRNSNILNAAKKGFKYYGFRWLIMEEKSKKKPVFGVNKKTEMVEVRFESIIAAVRELEGKNTNGIRKSLKNPGRFSWKGYYWFFG